MSSAIGLLSSREVTPSELAALVVESGGVVAQNNTGEGRISDGEHHIWIYLSPQELEGVMEVEGEAIVGKLGAQPKTNIVIEVSSTPGSEKLAVDFTRKFAERWPSVVATLTGNILSLDDLIQMQMSGNQNAILQ